MLPDERERKKKKKKSKERNAAVKMSVSLVGATRSELLARLETCRKNSGTLLGITHRFSDVTSSVSE